MISTFWANIRPTSTETGNEAGIDTEIESEIETDLQSTSNLPAENLEDLLNSSRSENQRLQHKIRVVVFSYLKHQLQKYM